MIITQKLPGNTNLGWGNFGYAKRGPVYWYDANNFAANHAFSFTD